MIEDERRDHDAAALPSSVYTSVQRTLSLNGEGIRIIHAPAAHSDGDSLVQFARADVIATGHIFDITRFPFIDVDSGGSVQGEIDALNRLLWELTLAPTPKWASGFGTRVIPARGHVCNQVDILAYRDMVTVIHDRVKAMVTKGASLEAVKQSAPARGYVTRYGAADWTADQFVEAIYKSLKAEQGAEGSEKI